MIHQTNPLLISWDEESGCYIVSDFYRHFQPIMTVESLGDFIKAYGKHSPEITRWTQTKGIKVEARREEELMAIEDWLARHVIEKPKAAPASLDSLSLEDLLKGA